MQMPGRAAARGPGRCATSLPGAPFSRIGGCAATCAVAGRGMVPLRATTTSASAIPSEAVATTRSPADILRQQQQQQHRLGVGRTRKQQQQQQQQQRPAPLATIAVAPASPSPLDLSSVPPGAAAAVAAAAAAAALALAVKRVYDTPSRAYDRNVGEEYDAWTQEGILEHYWGEHIHLGYYTDEELKKGWWRADFKHAKLRFTEQMFRFSGCPAPLPAGARVLDVGCGFGGSSRWLAATNPDARVTGITLSPRQVERGTELARQRGLGNVELRVMDALDMQFEDGTFDLVWACESGEHMPDKTAYVREMTRVLKPGGTLVLACWCQRDADAARGARPLTQDDRANLTFLCEEWAHPYFISIEEFGAMAERTGKMESVGLADWTAPTLASWRHSNLVGVLDPWYVVAKWNPRLWYKVTREIVTLERMHRAFARGLMVYGMMRATRKAAAAGEAASAAGGAAAVPAAVPAAATAAAAASR